MVCSWTLLLLNLNFYPVLKMKTKHFKRFSVFWFDTIRHYQEYMYIFSDEGQTLLITVGSLQFLGGASTSICHFVCQLVGQSIFLLCTISEEPYIIYFWSYV